jgi:CelD/BcsL family acetyltransferase involved in cellulose biosynthesis
VHVVPLRLSELSPRAHAAWDRLSDRATEPNPFFRRAFVQAAAAAHDRDPLLIVGSAGDEWVLCLPVDPVPRWRRLALPSLAPWMADYSYLAAPLIDADWVEDAARALAAFVATERRRAALILDPIDPESAAGAAVIDALVRAGRGPIAYHEWERGVLHRRPEPTYVEEAMSGKRRKELRRLRRALGRDLEAEVELVDRTHDADAAGEFLRLEGSGWKGDAGTALGSSPARASFFKAMCRAAEAAGRLQFLSLECAGKTIAMQCNLIDGDTLFGFKVAYDADFGRYSPGALLEVDSIGFFHESLDSVFADSCAAEDSDLVNRTWPDRRRMQTLIVPTAAARAVLIRPNLAVEALGRRVVQSARARWGRAEKS